MSKLALLKNWFKEHKGTVTAFSGGVDSSLVLYVSKMVLGNQAIGLISNSESLKSKDYKIATDFCKTHNINLRVIKTDELNDPNYTANPANRCFFCKTHLYEAMVDIIKEEYPEYTILNGTNQDDLGDYRPGLQAAKNHAIRSPLSELQISKKEVIEMAEALGLETAHKPPSPCLSSRIPYGTAVSNERLKQVEQAEYHLNKFGFFDVRVRHLGKEASIEVPEFEIERLKSHFDDISEGIKELGFSNVIIDEEGFVSGKLNRILNG
ncbi:ATP-dependent sacrificial sulfur transferase LarE [Cellulophaga baltica]|uniref:ATP-dependent sacrificial sulfur transferase LarE n=1 Tax=Cellulophaga TaxID=104264 RepID=UPI001C077FBA|nr:MULTISPECIES: ATP-dependent sacrificial sulfur transferase LarE [Cellulophaga]MBU2996794.1 ATP-dependent sacrificial sulfur transferase LarE [Cellulophaga baltica]MDO6768190.1 ATP-dependent sacrificial sulfur transferase LarE [Cellulophaga sp. 1_MG-2023]